MGTFRYSGSPGFWIIIEEDGPTLISQRVATVRITNGGDFMQSFA